MQSKHSKGSSERTKKKSSHKKKTIKKQLIEDENIVTLTEENL